MKKRSVEVMAKGLLAVAFVLMGLAVAGVLIAMWL